MNYLIALLLMISFAKFFGWVAEKAKCPSVVGEIIGGVILGPSFLHLIRPNDMVTILAQVGVVALMFIAGLTCDVDRLKKYFTPGIMVALLGVIFPVASIYVVCRYFQISIIESSFIGIVFAATSVSISVAVLDEMKELKSSAGVTILAAAVADDIISIVLLSVAVPVLGIGNGHGRSDALFLVLLQIVYFLFVWLCYRIIMIMRSTLEPLHINPGLLGLLFCLLLSGAAEMVKLSGVTGAFFAGLIISQTRMNKKLSVNMRALGGLAIIPIFFVSIGISMNVSSIFANINLFIILTILAIATKFIGAFIGAKVSRFDVKNASEIGAGMISRGEVGVVIAEAGLKSHFISNAHYSTLVAVIVVTTILAPIILKPIVLWKQKAEQ
ncbi:cation:proton antiporter [Apilactobacillus apinorum]|uniref:Cation:proton antiporter n=1 Tax=Apilactobacillus apinorum TaxID=1218495 RepID=A0ABP9ZG54_9LACO